MGRLVDRVWGGLHSAALVASETARRPSLPAGRSEDQSEIGYRRGVLVVVGPVHALLEQDAGSGLGARASAEEKGGGSDCLRGDPGDPSRRGQLEVGVASEVVEELVARPTELDASPLALYRELRTAGGVVSNEVFVSPAVPEDF